MDQNPIQGIASSLTKVTLQPGAGAPASKAAGAELGAALKSALEGVNKTQTEAEALAKAYQLEDPNVGLEETMVAMSKANIGFQTLVQVRNKLVSAYHDMMNMQI